MELLDQAVVGETVLDQFEKTTPNAGTGSCGVAGCGCQAFVPAGGGSGEHCIGRNAAGGTCNHWKSEHN